MLESLDKKSFSFIYDSLRFGIELEIEATAELFDKIHSALNKSSLLPVVRGHRHIDSFTVYRFLRDFFSSNEDKFDLSVFTPKERSNLIALKDYFKKFRITSTPFMKLVERDYSSWGLTIDVSLNQGIELVSPIFKYTEFLQQIPFLVRCLSNVGFVMNERTGSHISISSINKTSYFSEFINMVETLNKEGYSYFGILASILNKEHFGAYTYSNPDRAEHSMGRFFSIQSLRTILVDFLKSLKNSDGSSVTIKFNDIAKNNSLFSLVTNDYIHNFLVSKFSKSKETFLRIHDKRVELRSFGGDIAYEKLKSTKELEKMIMITTTSFYKLFDKENFIDLNFLYRYIDTKLFPFLSVLEKEVNGRNVKFILKG